MLGEAWRGRILGLLAFTVSIAFWPGVPDAALVLRWSALAVGLALLVATGPAERRLTPAHAAGAVFLLWAFLGLSWAPVAAEWADGYVVLLILAGAFMVGAATPDLRPAYDGLAAGMAISGLLAMLQLEGHSPVEQLIAPAGLFYNPAFLAESASVAVIAAIGARRWGLVGPCLLAALLPMARGPVLGLAAAAFLGLWARSRRVAIAAGVAGLLGIAALSPFHEHAGFSSTAIRTALWVDTWDGLSVAGGGLGSFFVTFPAFMHATPEGIGRPGHPHNEFLDFAFELGAGAVLLLFVLAYALTGPMSTELLILVAVATESCFAFPLHTPVTGFAAALAAGRLCAARSPLRDRLVRRGAALCQRLGYDARGAPRRLPRARSRRAALPAE